jgi:hypothetical protein
MDPQEKSSWMRLAITVLLELLGIVIGVAFSVSWALGKYEERFDTYLERVNKLERSVGQLVSSEVNHTQQLVGLTRDVVSVEGQITQTRIEVQTDMVEMKKDIKERLDLIIRLIDRETQ